MSINQHQVRQVLSEWSKQSSYLYDTNASKPQGSPLASASLILVSCNCFITHTISNKLDGTPKLSPEICARP